MFGGLLLKHPFVDLTFSLGPLRALATTLFSAVWAVRWQNSFREIAGNDQIKRSICNFQGKEE